MKKYLFMLLFLVSTATAQTSGEHWVLFFDDGSTEITDVDSTSLAVADSIVATLGFDMDIVFYGSANKVGWIWEGNKVKKEINTIWNDAIRLSRARVLQERYNRGLVSITHEDTAGVKMVWKPVFPKTDIHVKEGDIHYNIQVDRSSTVVSNWKLKAGISAWSFEDNQFAVPYVGSGIALDKWQLMLYLGGLPFTVENETSHSYLSGQGIYHFNDSFGVTSKLWLSWLYLTESDTWIKKAVGLSGGITWRISMLEFTPMVNVSNQVYYDSPKNDWHIGLTLDLGVYIK